MSTVIGSSGTPDPEEPQDTQDAQDPQDSQDSDDSREEPQIPEVDGDVDPADEGAVDPADEGELDPEEWDESEPEPEPEPGEKTSPARVRAYESTAAPRAEAAAEEPPTPVDDAASRAKRMRRRRRAVGSVGLAVVVIGVVGAIMPFTPMMPVHGINVDGTQNLSVGEVQDLTGIEPETPMGRVDVQGAAQRVAGIAVDDVRGREGLEARCDGRAHRAVVVAGRARRSGLLGGGRHSVGTLSAAVPGAGRRGVVPASGLICG